ncbi:MAG TPA: homogentisate 1,2-dioxygenase [Gammaproteobacteria bacterium]|nr:homogentisate 1,2-dioxygenase [Gammaproteobacteria bacterium]
MDTMDLAYLCGFGSYWESEALPNALPKGQNSPKKNAYGLYTEQLSGSAFTRLRHENLRTWLYRILPSVLQEDFTAYKGIESFHHNASYAPPPNQMRWDPLPIPDKPLDFIHSLQHVLYNGDPCGHLGGAAIYVFCATTSMQDTYFYNADGELLIVPYLGAMRIRTELGILEIVPGEILCVPRGVKFCAEVLGSVAAGYVCENWGAPFSLPYLGPIGSNGLANPRDFKIPMANYEDKSGECLLICKYLNNFWQASLSHSPLNVVAWHGNYSPYKYDLRLFNTINTVSFDHPDPSIFTVLTSPTSTPGLANVDFVIFPERWMVAEHTFRPPYYHRNIMSEYMGLIYGVYDAKSSDFKPGGGSLHNCMSAHGPDKETFLKAQQDSESPYKITDTLACMFESSKPWIPTPWANHTPLRQKNYVHCWQNLPKLFNK